MIEHSTFAPTQRRSWPSCFLENGDLEYDLEGRYVIDASCKQVLHEPCAGRKLLRNPFQYHQPRGPLRLPMRTPYALPLSFVSERLPGDETFQAMKQHCKVDVLYSLLSDITSSSTAHLNHMDNSSFAHEHRHPLRDFIPISTVFINPGSSTTQLVSCQIYTRQR